MIPSMIAAPAMIGSRSIPPITAAARARSRIAGPEHLADRQTDDAGPEEDGDEREQRRDHPDDRLQAAHRDAEHQGAVGALGSRPDGDADLGAGEEEREREEHEGDHDRGDDVAAAERDGVDGHARVERLGDRVAAQREQAGQEQRAGGQQLREPDRRDGEDETRRLREPTDDHDLDDGPERERGREPDGEAAPPPEADGADGEQDGERRRDGAEVTGGEVDDAVGAPDDGEAEREERAQPADDRALHEDACGDVPCDDDEEQDRDGDEHRREKVSSQHSDGLPVGLGGLPDEHLCA